MKSAKVLGYYNHDNFGDEQYKITISKLLNHYQDITFLDINSNLNLENESSDIFVGGGDILNDYFLDKLIEGNIHSKICGISIGCPYITSNIVQKISKIFHTLFFRSRTDLEQLSPLLPDINCFYMPDTSVLWDVTNTISSTTNNKIGICLPQSFYNKLYPDEYNNIVNSFAEIFEKLIQDGYKLYFIPFNTNQTNPNENDILLANSIVNKLSTPQNIIILDSTDLSVFSQMNYMICGRYHSVLFSIYYSIPFFPVFTTRKIKNFLLENNWNIGYELEKNWKDVPTHLDVSIFLSRITSFFTNSGNQRKLDLINNRLNSEIKNISDLIMQSRSPCNYCKLWTLVQKNIHKSPKFLTKMCMYKLIGMANSKYNWGLEQKIKTKNFDYHKEFDFIVEDSKKWKVKIPSNPDGLFKLSFIDQIDYHQVHRSGWDYVVKNMMVYNNDNSNLLLDTYLDRTFHWDKPYLETLGMLPYTQPWIGFIHHTFNTTFSDYNSENLLKDPLFIESLKYCKGLFVLSSNMAEKIKKKLTVSIPVYNLTHPTLSDYSIPLFDFCKFKKNKNKKILNIGGWMRDIYSFYRLDVSKFITCKCCFKKVAIKGKFMNNYFPSITFLSNLLSNDKGNDTDYQGTIVSHPPITPSFNSQFYNHIKSEIDSVQLISNLSNEEYDKILTNNIVYIKLFDAAAVNTLLECVVRTCPIIINRLPAVVEILGENYPLYIEKLSSVSCRDIKAAHLYLKKIHKDILFKTNIETFMQNFINTLL